VTNRPSEIDDLYERLGVSRDCTRQWLDIMYRQKCMMWNPSFKGTETEEPEDDLLALKDAYKIVSEHMGAQSRVERAKQATRNRPRYHRNVVDILQCLREARVA
jgi:hypothetical protein